MTGGTFTTRKSGVRRRGAGPACVRLRFALGPRARRSIRETLIPSLGAAVALPPSIICLHDDAPGKPGPGSRQVSSPLESKPNPHWWRAGKSAIAANLPWLARGDKRRSEDFPPTPVATLRREIGRASCRERV